MELKSWSSVVQSLVNIILRLTFIFVCVDYLSNKSILVSVKFHGDHRTHNFQVYLATLSLGVLSDLSHCSHIWLANSCEVSEGII